MPVKVKRGLGLLVVAALGLLVAQFAMQAQASGSDGQALVGNAFVLVAAVAVLGGLVGGLVLIAWGLLRD